MPLLWVCCHCGHVQRMPDVLDGMQGRCRACLRYAIIQGAHVSEDEDSAAGMRSMAPESAMDEDEAARQSAAFPLRDFEATSE